MWILEKTLSVGNFYIPGWSSYFPSLHLLMMEPSIFIAVLLFIVPESNKKEPINLGCKIPWGIILLGEV
jgi:hypothetical protein